MSYPDRANVRVRDIASSANALSRCLALTLLLLCLAGRALAQTEWQDRAFINVNVGFEPETLSFDEYFMPVIYDERAAVLATHRVDGGLALLDLGGGVRIWRGLGVGVSYTRFAPADTTVVAATVPHPLLFNKPRRSTTTAESSYIKTAYNFDAVWMIPLSSRADLALSGGPTMLVVSQDLVSGIAVAEDSPSFSTVEIAKVDILGEKSRVLGASLAADLTYFFKPMIGVGANIRYLIASIDVTQNDGTSLSLDPGGFRFAVGARLRIR